MAVTTANGPTSKNHLIQNSFLSFIPIVGTTHEKKLLVIRCAYVKYAFAVLLIACA